MEYLRIKKSFAFGWAMLFSLFLPFGVFLTVYGFVNIHTHIMWGILGIILTLSSFYSVPFLWIYFAKFVSMKKLCTLIVEGKIYSISDLCSRLKKPEKYVLRLVKTMIQRGFLLGFTLDNAKYLRQL